jgi:hypothetical protein
MHRRWDEGMAARVKLLRSHAVSIQHFLSLADLTAYQARRSGDAHGGTLPYLPC